MPAKRPRAAVVPSQPSTAPPRLHGEGKYEANEGIALAAIRQAWRS
jgi:hypothetical protein